MDVVTEGKDTSTTTLDPPPPTMMVPNQDLPVSLNVLVVDDAVMNRKLLVRLLQNKGHKCEQAVDGAEAVEKVSKALEAGKPFDSILLDYEMPQMDGPTAASRMSQLQGFNSYVVGITGNVLPEDVAHFKKCGAQQVLPKPLDVLALTSLWEEAGIKAPSSQENNP